MPRCALRERRFTSVAHSTGATRDDTLAKAIAESCEVDEASARISSCNGNEAYAIVDRAANQQVAGVYESLAELARPVT
ncbi:MAG: hypothetical protein KIT31_14930 [Deltaproteobacteria bacterium]|nr:hypothetical protein [Deltaproteobacteria bacterium]